MSCHHYRLLLAFRPSELAADDRHALDVHLSGCAACASAAASDRATDAAIRTAMLAVPVPTDLRAKLHAGLSASQGAAWRRRVGVAAAGLTLAVGLVAACVFTLPVFFRTPFDTAGLSAALDKEGLGKEDSVKKWMDAEGMPAKLPEDFDFSQHSFHGTERVGTQNLPVIVFRNPSGECRVFILKKDRHTFPKDGLDPVEGSNFRVKAVDAGDWVFVVAHPGNVPLETFLRQIKPAV